MLPFRRTVTSRSVARRTTFALALVLTPCASVGPGTVAVDRFDYSSAIADSWKQQKLLNKECDA